MTRLRALSRPSVWSGADPWDLSRLEVVKAVAFVAMLADHFDLWLFGRQFGLDAVGRFAFPAFALCVGLGLSHSRTPERVALRLLLPAVIAQGVWWSGGFQHPANVLFVFGLCALAAKGLPCRYGKGIAWSFVIVACGFVGEGGAFGALMACAGFYAARRRDWLPVLAVAVVWCALSPSWAALLAFVTVSCFPANRVVPRVRGLLAWGYPLHLALLAFAARVA